ncbi:hypothetical protein FQZ97_645620 [compost metagenome]
MDSTNNPETGTGLTVAEAATHIEKLLDSPSATIREEVDADSELEDSQTLEDEDDDDETEQAEEDSVEVEGETESETTEEAESVSEATLKDDTLVDVNGQNVPLRELRDGYLRRSDYTRKTQELKQHMNTYALQQKEIATIRAEVLENHNQAIRVFNATFNMSEPDWDYLSANEPDLYIAARHDWDKKLQAIAAMESTRRELVAKDERATLEQVAIKQMQALDELSEKYPTEFGDATRQRGLLNEVGGYLANLGYDEAEIVNIADSRIIETAYKAMKYDAMTQRKAEVVKKIQSKPALTMPGSVTAKPNTKDQSIQKDRQRLRESGRLEDAAALISKYL